MQHVEGLTQLVGDEPAVDVQAGEERFVQDGAHGLVALGVQTGQVVEEIKCASEQYNIDGSLLQCWSWRSDPDLYLGKHKTTGLNLQFACTLHGDLSWISDPLPGSRHDAHCVSESGVLDGFPPHGCIGDKGYIGLGMITPYRKPPGRELLNWQIEFNTQLNKIRYVIERAIANFKTWRLTHTDYRRPLKTFAETMSTVIALQFFRPSCE